MSETASGIISEDFEAAISIGDDSGVVLIVSSTWGGTEGSGDALPGTGESWDSDSSTPAELPESGKGEYEGVATVDIVGDDIAGEDIVGTPPIDE